MSQALIRHDDVAVYTSTRRRSVRSYRGLAKAMHWLTAALVLVQVALGVVSKQLSEGAIADALLNLHKALGALILAVVFIRLSYRLFGIERVTVATYRHPFLHWMLYVIIIAVPLFGWAGVSDFGARDILFGYSLPSIWPEGAGYADLLLGLHAYLAFGLMALVALHVGNALHDYMTRSDG
jgi:cytochrome b561